MDQRNDFGDNTRTFTDDDDRHYRRHYESLGTTGADYDRARTGYQYGHTAGMDPSYRGRRYEEVETDLRTRYTGSDYDTDRDYIRYGYDRSSSGDLVGEATGGTAGALTGAALGSAGGPLGTIIGGIAGAVGGWWAGREISHAAADYTAEDDQYYRRHYDSMGTTGVDYEQARTGYQLGHFAGTNPDYHGRRFEEVEPDLQHGFRGGDYDYHTVRDYVRHGYERSVTRFTTAGATTEASTTTAAGANTARTDDRLDQRTLRDRGEDDPSAGDLVGEAAGGVSGVLTGAALGSMGGPVGTVIGGIAGAIGGWWTGRAVSEAASGYTDEDETYYRSHYDSYPDRSADVDYDRARTGYQLGHIAGANPDYRGRQFDEVEPDLRRGFGDRETDYDSIRDYARHGYERSTERFTTKGASGSSAGAQVNRDVGVGDDSGLDLSRGGGTTGNTERDRSIGGTLQDDDTTRSY